VKIFNTSRITKSQLRQVVCKSAKEMGVSKVIFNSTAKHVSGSYNAENNVMFLDTKLTKKELLDTFFHELGHHVAVKQNKWRGYHYDLNPNITKEEIFKTENKIDQIGNRLWNKYVNIKQWGRYKYAYPIKYKNILMKTFFNN
jgi:Zn-dependent peptidase ImmA (M78 family)